LHEHASIDPRASRLTVERFEREIQSTARLDHPHVVRILDWGATDDGIWYYAMEILDGVDLARLVEDRGPLEPTLAVRLTVQAARALGAAHRAGIVHRDVKPANLFVVERDSCTEIKVLDFGVARVHGNPAITRTGARVGTPSFMSPEVLAGAEANEQSDVWSLAATLHFAVTGKRLRDVEAADATELPPGLAAVLLLALSSDPELRPRDGEAFANALEATSPR
jgi:serine/threonine-protein kinase